MARSTWSITPSLHLTPSLLTAGHTAHAGCFDGVNAVQAQKCAVLHVTVCKQWVCSSCWKPGICRHNDNDILPVCGGNWFGVSSGSKRWGQSDSVRQQYNSQAVIKSSLQCQELYKLYKGCYSFDASDCILASNAVLYR